MKAIAIVLQITAALSLLHFAKAKRNYTVAFEMPYHSEWKNFIDHAIQQYTAINPADYKCRGAPDKEAWINGVLSQIRDLENLLRLDYEYGIFNWSLFYSWLIDMDDSDEVFGINDRQQNKEYRKRFRQLKRFWDIKSSDILLKAMKGSALADTDKMVHMFRYWYRDEYGDVIPEPEVQAVVAEVQDFIKSDPGLGFDNPLFTFNAYAVTSVGFEDDPFVGNVPDNIVLGDGLLAYFEKVGLDDNGPEMIIAHEFAHHIQFELGLFDLFAAETPEATRKLELMADALGAYFLAHKNGASFQKKNIADVYKTAFDFGDCAFDSIGHHGTPYQREKATMFGASLAAKNDKRFLKAAKFVAKFEAKYSDLVAADIFEQDAVVERKTKKGNGKKSKK